MVFYWGNFSTDSVNDVQLISPFNVKSTLRRAGTHYQLTLSIYWNISIRWLCHSALFLHLNRIVS
mgnify:CR=1 FL=1